MKALAVAFFVLISSPAFAASGTVKWYNDAKGFGFITPDDGGKDIFVHVTAVKAAGLTTLKAGQKVEYDAVPSQSAPSAEHLKLK